MKVTKLNLKYEFHFSQVFSSDFNLKLKEKSTVKRFYMLYFKLQTDNIMAMNIKTMAELF